MLAALGLVENSSVILGKVTQFFRFYNFEVQFNIPFLNITKFFVISRFNARESDDGKPIFSRLHIFMYFSRCDCNDFFFKQGPILCGTFGTVIQDRNLQVR